MNDDLAGGGTDPAASADEPTPTGGLADATSPASPDDANAASGSETPVPARRRVSGRWAIALLIAVAVVGAGAAAILLASGGGSVSRLAGWVPAGSYVYAEVRVDPPGDQGQRFADLVAHFPGFADRSQLDTKLTEVLDRALGKASSGKVTFAGIRPWLGDSMAVAAKTLPAAGTANGSALLIVATKDAGKARDWLSANVSIAGATAEAYGGAQLTTGMQDGMAWAYTVLDTVVLAGEKGAVEDAIDTKGAGPFPTSEPFRSAAASVAGDDLGFAFVDTKAVVQAAIAAGVTSGAVAPVENALVDRVPAWAAMVLHARSDALEVVLAAPVATSTTDGTPATNRASTLAGRLPPSTLAAAEGRDVGRMLVAILAGLKADPTTAATAAQVEALLQTVGGVDATVGWIGDGALVVTGTGDGSLAGGLVVATSDEKVAAAKLTQLRSLLALAGGSAGITVTDESYGDGTITIIDLGDLRALAGAAGASGTTGTPTLPPGRVRLALTVQRGLFVLGSDDGFVKAVLDTAPGASLADQPGYRAALERAGSLNAGQVYVDLAGVVGAVLPFLPADARSSYEQDVKPFVDRLAASALAGITGDPMRVRFVVTVK